MIQPKQEKFSIHTRLLLIAGVILVLVALLYWYHFAFGKSYEWVQSTWDASGDNGATPAQHNPSPAPGTPQANWSKYTSRDTASTTVITGGDGTTDIQLKFISATTTHDTKDDFVNNQNIAGSSQVGVTTGGSVTIAGSGVWAPIADYSVNVGPGGFMAYDGDNYIYLLLGDSGGGFNQGFARYKISGVNGGTWETLATLPGNYGVSAGGAIVFVPAIGPYGPSIYASRGSGSALFFRYDINSAQWDSTFHGNASHDLPAAAGNGASLFYRNGSNLISYLKGGTGGGRVYYFNVLTQQWLAQNNEITFSGGSGGGGGWAYGTSTAGSRLSVFRGRGSLESGTCDFFSYPGTCINTYGYVSGLGAGAIDDGTTYATDLLGGGAYMMYPVTANSGQLYKLTPNPASPQNIAVTPVGVVGSGISLGQGAAMVHASSTNQFFLGQGGYTRKFFQYPAYYTSGTYESNVINLGSLKKLNKITFDSTVPSATTLAVQVRTGDTPTYNAASWTAYTTYTSGASLAGLNGSNGGRQYVQYKVIFTTTDNTKSSALNSISFSYDSYAASGGLISSPYNSSDSTTAIAQVKWTEDSTLPLGTTFRVQLRSAASSAGLSSAQWYGPTGAGSYYQSSDTGSCTKASDVVTCSIIPAALTDGVNDQWFQYQVLLGSSGPYTPTLKSFTLTYVINSAPAVAITNTPSKGSSGTVQVIYNLSDLEEPSIQVFLFYDIAVTIGGSTPLGANDTTIIVSGSNVAALPASGILMIEGEQISYASKSGNSLSGLVRGLNSTNKASHAVNTPVWMKANSVTGDVGMVGVGSNKSIIWAPNTDIPGIFAQAAKVRVSANDQNAANQIGLADAVIAGGVDTIPPSVGAIPIAVNSGDVKTTSANVTLTLDATDAQGTLNMSISNDGVFDTEPLEVFSASKSWTLTAGDGVKTVYVQFKDGSGNPTGTYSDTIILDATAPQTPSGLSVSEGTNEATGDVILVLTWSVLNPVPMDAGGPDFDSYVIYRSPAPNGSTPDAQGFGLLTNISNINGNTYADLVCTGGVSGPCVGQTYQYKIAAQDNVANISAVSSPASGIPAGKATDVTGPSISSGSISLGSQGAAYVPISWTAVESPSTDRSDSTVAYVAGTAYDFTSASTQSDPSLVPSGSSHTVYMVGLTPGQTYSFEVRSQDQVGNLGKATSTTGIFTFPSIDTSGPIISGVTATPYTQSGSVSWVTDEPATSFVEYGGVLYGSFLYTQNHVVTLPSSLQSSTLHVVTINSSDIYGNTSSQTTSFTTNAAATTTLQINESSIAATPTVSSASIVWTTNKTSSSYVEFGTKLTTDGKPIYDHVEGSRTFASGSSGVFTHTVLLNAVLNAATQYHYRVRSIDDLGQEDISEQYIFTTLPVTSPDVQAPVISNVAVRGVGKNAALITWTTNEPTDSTVEYSATSTVYNLSKTIPGYRTSHAVEITGLSSGKLYRARVQSRDPSGNISTSDNSSAGYAFATLGATVGGGTNSSLVISNVNVVTSGGDTTINWTTNEASFGYVEFGFDKQYVESYASSLTPTTNHSVTLPAGILGNVTYVFQVRARTSDGRSATSQDIASFTAPPSAATIAADDTTPPVISQITVPFVTEKEAVISWVTDELATAEIDYGQTTLYGLVASSSPGLLNRSHSINLTDLEPGTTYYFRVSSGDAGGNLARQDSQSAGSCSSVISQCLQFSTKALTDPTVVVTPQNEEDIDAPLITSVTISDITSVGATISWDTSEDANSLVEVGTLPDQYEKGIFGKTDDFTVAHEVVLDQLSASTTYYFMVTSFDRHGNRGKSDEFSFTTAPEDEALKALKKKLELDLEQQQIDFLKSLTELSSSTQSIVTNFLAAIKDLAEDEKDKIMQILFGQVLGPPRIITATPIVNVTDTTATITWETSKDTSGIVSYIPEASYKPDAKNPYGLSAGDKDAFGSTHNVVITDLKPFTTYHYQLQGEEKNGKALISVDRTFQTLPTRPKIKVQVTRVTERAATIMWTTSIPTEGAVEFKDPVTGQLKSQGTERVSTKQVLDLVDLAPNTTYRGAVVARSEDGVITRSAPFTFKTGRDNVPPEFSQIRTKLTLSPGKEDVVQAVITWKTNEPANTQVFYAEGVKRDDLLTAGEKAPLQDDLVTSHVVVLNKLRPGTVYRFRAVSYDAAGNHGSSKEFKLITPRKAESVLELIIKNFEEAFGFLKGGK